MKDQYGDPYEPPQLWMDISEKLENAQILIYIIGWSVKANISLKRNGGDELLGDLLLRKANEGVCVLIMIWDEPMSNDLLPGMMGVHDEQTENFFKGTKVHVCKAFRETGNKGMIQNMYLSTIFTHHQKCIIVDSEINGRSTKRKLTTFQGGIDLSGGRWVSSLFYVIQFLNSLSKRRIHQSIVYTKH